MTGFSKSPNKMHKQPLSMYCDSWEIIYPVIAQQHVLKCYLAIFSLFLLHQICYEFQELVEIFIMNNGQWIAHLHVFLRSMKWETRNFKGAVAHQYTQYSYLHSWSKWSNSKNSLFEQYLVIYVWVGINRVIQCLFFDQLQISIVNFTLTEDKGWSTGHIGVSQSWGGLKGAPTHHRFKSLFLR